VFAKIVFQKPMSSPPSKNTVVFKKSFTAVSALKNSGENVSLAFG
jgi:hypothetical protein